MISRREQGKRTVQHTFGGVLSQQGRGFYTALELFAILRGEHLLEKAEGELGLDSTAPRLLPTSDECLYLRPSHDFARRLMAGDPRVSGHEKLKGPATERTLRALLRGLENPIPGARQAPKNWSSRHFFPFPGELAHYDAVYRGRGASRKVSTETYIFRGGGGLAHKILRTDPDADRLARTRDGFRRLVSDSGSTVGRIASALSNLDDSKAYDWSDPSEEALKTASFRDQVEERSWADADRQETRWFELLRDGVSRVLRRKELTEFHRVEVLMHLVPFCLSMHQLAMAWRALGRDENGSLVLDAGHGPGAVRELARQHLNQCSGAITAALMHRAGEMGYEELGTGRTAWRDGPRTFFTATMYAVGAVNAPTGRRFLAVRPALLETLVAAFVDGHIPFSTFTRDILCGRLGLVTDYPSAQAAGGFDLDRADLDENRRHLGTRLAGLGLLQEYSDATKMVGIVQ